MGRCTLWAGKYGKSLATYCTLHTVQTLTVVRWPHTAHYTQSKHSLQFAGHILHTIHSPGTHCSSLPTYCTLYTFWLATVLEIYSCFWR